MTELTQAIVRELLDYDPISGKLTWKWRDAKWFKDGKVLSSKSKCSSWNKKYANKPAFEVVGSHGYNQGYILDKLYLAHRVIWLWMTGEWPIEVDHENRIRTDNRWLNIREVSKTINNQNKRIPDNNTSGHLGVHYVKRRNKWRAEISIGGKIIVLKVVDSFDEACMIRKEAERRFGFHPNHGVNL